MPDVFGGLAIGVADVIVAPHRVEFRAQPAEFIDQRFDVRRRAGSCCVRAERRHHKPGIALPIRHRGAKRRIAEDEAQAVALLGGERSIVGQHRRGGAVPRDDVPCGGLHIGRAEFERVEHALQSRRNTLGRVIADFGRPAQREQEQVLALDVGQHQGARDAVEHVGRGRAAAPLFEPCVPGRADVGALRHFFAPQSGRSPACQRKAECRRIEFRAAILQVGCQADCRRRLASMLILLGNIPV